VAVSSITGRSLADPPPLLALVALLLLSGF
jgi:hypothetical protein